ncbi:hybrid sensor histidine kinase/response regulator transcription factor [Chitinophaga tropicalis]|uniref:histidine kinase n=1 Tax=Chitinophaga tropicalis TaxID=2683588 RepID=A0A7K1U7M3_9BACT|nr:two-component regulator propeller domain-containing protein [Chitinophaga tropicalis]MVT10359.1 response regulator [Chitinophaga tropicalis]
MKSVRVIYLLHLTICFLHISSLCFGQLVASNISTPEGLSNFTAKTLYQDSQGLVWIGTNDGLNYYDGKDFTVYRNRPNDSTSIVGNWITGITEDTTGHLWVATRQGVSIFEKVTGFFKHAVLNENGVNRALQYVTGVVCTGRDAYASTEGTGVVAFFNLGQSGTRIPVKIRDRQEYDYKVLFIAKDSSGTLWALIQGKGLFSFDKENRCLVLKEPSLKGATCMEVEQGKIWLGDGEGVTEYDIRTRAVRRLYNKTVARRTGERITAIKADKEHNLWLAVNSCGLFVLEPVKGTVHPVNTTYPLGDRIESVYCLQRDSDGRMWAGTIKKGIFLFDPGRNDFGTYAYQAASGKVLADNVVFSIEESMDNVLWVGTDGKGLHRWDRGSGHFDSYIALPGVQGHLSGNAICDMVCTPDGDLWLATSANGISRYRSEGGAFRQYECNNPSVGKSNSVFSIAATSDGYIWAGTLKNNGGLGALYRYQREKDRFEVFDPSLSDLMVLKELPDSTFWGGNLHEVVLIDKTAAKRHRRFEIGCIVRSVCEAGPGKLWVGTEGNGLLLLDLLTGKIVKQYTSADGLCNDAVLNIVKDGAGRLWMGTAYGLACFVPGKVGFMNYYREDGLPANQFSFHAARRLADGKMAFGCAQGLIIFNPLDIHPPKKPSTPVVIMVRVAGQPLSRSSATWRSDPEKGTGRLTLPFESASLVLDYTAPEFTSPGQLRYSYYLEGWDKEWNDAGVLQSVAYSGLREGEYKLKIRVRTISGEWGEEMQPILITVFPPWYRSWWAYCLYLLSGFLSIGFYVSYRARQKRLLYEVRIARLTADTEKAEKEKRQAELERKEAEHAAANAEREKEKILIESERELNERRKDFFTSISHEFRTPLTLIVNPVKKLQEVVHPAGQKEILNTIYLNSKRLLSLVDQLLLFNKSESGFDTLRVSRLDLGEICKEVFRCFVSQAAARKISFTFECAFNDIPVYADKMKLEIILFNLLSNAIKFTPEGGNVALRIENSDGTYNIYVSDTGEGILPALGNQLFKKFGQAVQGGTTRKTGFGVGLYLARAFAEAHKGSLSFESRLGEGTIFRLALKKEDSHFQLEEIMPDSKEQESLVGELYLDSGATAATSKQETSPVEDLAAAKYSLLVIDDDSQMLRYLADIFRGNYRVFEACDGAAGLKIAGMHRPDLIISDIHMGGISGIDLCRTLKEVPETAHIPVILLTGSQSDALRLEGVEGGADDYITKPFDADLLFARVTSIIKARKGLQQYFLNEVTLQNNDFKISAEYRQFLETCIEVVGRHLDDEEFEIRDLAKEMGMSYSTLYNRIKAISGLSVNAFIRYLRLRKAAEMLVKTDMRVNQVAFSTGFNHLPYFRKCFLQLFGMTPSEYVKKYRDRLGDNFSINKNSFT